MRADSPGMTIEETVAGQDYMGCWTGLYMIRNQGVGIEFWLSHIKLEL